VKKRIVVIAAGVIVVVATFVFVLPRVADYRAVWATIKGLTWEQLAELIVAVVLNIITFAPPFMATLPGLGFVRALMVTQASTASTYVLPGGGAVGAALSYGMLRGWGFSTGAVALAVGLTGAWNQLFMLGAPVIALALLTLEGGSNRLLQTVAAIGLVIFLVAVAAFVAALSGDRLAGRIGDLAARGASWVLGRVRRGPVGWTGQSLIEFRRRAVGILRRRWWLLSLGTIAGNLTVFLVLVVCLRAMGVTEEQVTLVEAFAAWTLVRLLGSIPLTPGGIGVVELGLTAALVGFGGNNDGVVAAVLLYRVATIVPTLVLGGIAGAFWRHGRPPEPATASATGETESQSFTQGG
jgi:uncharacterized protein (TIRG00374 family)